ncbi:MAG: hypothetical protein COB14_07640 [Alphaproteobacteria bacterium]|nr:MAG: hypothetical protein COB14_07640 [Alphaproteobacteria bacterium]
MVCIFTISTAQPFMSADAAELWNKKSSGKSAGKTYRNKPRSTGTHSFFNRKGLSSRVENKTAKYRGHSGYGFYTEVRMSKQKKSRQWARMSSSSVRNRQNDLDLALQQEYTILKNVAKKMNIASKKQQESRYQDYKRHQKEVVQYKLDYAKSKVDEEKRRDRAYAKLSNKKGWSSRRSSKSSTRKSASSKRSTGLKKPKRLFNDPYK